MSKTNTTILLVGHVGEARWSGTVDVGPATAVMPVSAHTIHVKRPSSQGIIQCVQQSVLMQGAPAPHLVCLQELPPQLPLNVPARSQTSQRVTHATQ